MPTFIKDGPIETSFGVCTVFFPLASICFLGLGLSCHVFSAEVFDLKVKARLDKDGSAGPDQPGDIVGMSQVVKRGSTNIKIVLDQG